MPQSERVNAGSETTGFLIKYGSLQDLAEDQSNLLQHAALFIPWAGTPPAAGALVRLKMLVPGGAGIELGGAVDRMTEGKGFRVAIDGKAAGAQSTLQQLIASPAFQRALQSEPPNQKNTRQVSSYPIASMTGMSPPRVVSSTASGDATPRPASSPGGLPAPKIPPASSTGSARLPPPVAISSAKLPAPNRPPTPSPAAEEEDQDDQSETVDRYDDYDDDFVPDENEEIGVQETDEDQPPVNFKTPAPGESYVVFVVKFATVRDFVDLSINFSESARIKFPCSADESNIGDLAQLRLVLPGRNIFTMWAVVEKSSNGMVQVAVSSESPSFQNACLFPRSIGGKRRLDTERDDQRRPIDAIRFVQERAEIDIDRLPLKRRLQRMSMDDKINMALSGNRQERMALAQDGNKAIQHYLLKNARISLDEIAFIARLPTMNPDVLARIGETPNYVQNQTVLKNLIYNPKTPITLAIRLLDRLPRSEVLSLSKRMSMNGRLVQAAKKKIEGRSK